MKTAYEAPVVEPRTVEGRTGAAIALHDVGHSFGELEVLAGLELEVGDGELVGLVGPSGCGKSTVLELVAGLQEQGAGEVRAAGATAAAERLRACALMPQRDLLLPWLTALDNAALAERNRGASRAAARAAARPLFERFGLAGFERARPAALSGGMRQRVAFLRTLLARKPVLLLDEPFASLDAISRGEMQEWLAGAVAEAGRTGLLVTHDVEEALYLCDRVAILSARPARVVAELPAPAPRAHPRTEAITSSEFAAARELALRTLQDGLR
jgi:ABC-type nitrate/sulfonate/bicarbonate transport system ATPase subunit